MTPEGKVKKMVDDYMAKHFPGAWRYNPPGGAFGKAGVPDKLFVYQGVLIAIETKAEGGKATKLQKKNLLHLRDQGAICAIVEGMDIQKMDKIKSVVLQEIERRGNIKYGTD